MVVRTVEMYSRACKGCSQTKERKNVKPQASRCGRGLAR